MDSLLLRRRIGYEYRYQFDTAAADEDLIEKYKPKVERGRKIFLFEFRTSFIAQCMVTGSESYAATTTKLSSETLAAECDRGSVKSVVAELDILLGLRLDEYWMPVDELHMLLNEAADYAKRQEMAASARVIPIVVNLQVVTVQQAGETGEEAMERAITKEQLLPSYLLPRGMVPPGTVERRHSRRFTTFLRSVLERTRVEDVDEGVKQMPACEICGKAPTIGSLITEIPCCNHPFHSHCLLKWLETCTDCPVCKEAAYDLELRIP